MQYTLRNIPKKLDDALRAKARREGKSLNEAALEALGAGAGVTLTPSKRRDLSDIAGSWVQDPAFDAAFKAQDKIDTEKWR